MRNQGPDLGPTLVVNLAQLEERLYGGSEGVGWATTRAVVNTSLTTIILNFVISGIGFVIFPV